MQITDTDAVTAVKEWLAANWDPDLSVRAWWERLGTSGWAAPSLPETCYGKGLSRAEVVRVQDALAEFGALGAPGGLGLLLAGPTIATHGTQEQIDHYVRDIVTGQQAWCQLFSEPGAGSDLAGLTTRAIEDGEEWVVNGQKVWTSTGQMADMGMLLARTDWDVPKHQGITYFAIDMHQDGVEVRPLRELTGHAMFNEVFLSEARVRSDAIIGGKNNGWAVANTTLANERAGLGAGGGGGGGFGAAPGTISKQLDRKVAEFVNRDGGPPRGGRRGGGGGGGAGGGARAGAASLLIGLAQGNGKIKDPTVRQDIARLHIMGELGRFNAERVKAARSQGKDIPGMANISKLAMSDMVRMQRDLGLRIVGAQGMLHAYKDEDNQAINEATGNPFLGAVTTSALYAQAPPIYGGTDQIQRNIIGERVLGLPKEPSNDRTVAFSELPRNG